MSNIALIPYLFLVIRIILLGFERIFLKLMGSVSDEETPIASTIVFFGIGTLALFPFAIGNYISTNSIVVAFISSLFYSAAFWLYTASIQKGEVSLVTPLYNFNIIFLFIFSVLFLQESIDFFKVIRILLIFIGLSFLQESTNIIDSLENLFRDKACQMMIISSLLTAIGRIFDGFAIDFSTPTVYSFFIYFFVTFNLALILTFKGRLSLTKEIVQMKPKISISAGLVNAFSYLALLIAFTAIDVSIAEPVSSLNVFIVLILAKLVFQEKVRQRVIAASFIVIGVFLIFLPTILLIT